MVSYKYAGLIIAIAMIVFSLLTLVIFFYCMYVIYQENWDQSANEVTRFFLKMLNIGSYFQIIEN